MKVVIIEDEHLTADRIRSLIEKIEPGVTVLAVLDSVKSAVNWFRKHDKPDLVLMDIQLADGLSFQIFDQVDIEYPVVFITAYQEYAIRAFKVNSVDYLLKPVTEEALLAAIEKYQRFFVKQEPIPFPGRELMGTLREMMQKPFKSRFMVKVGEHIKSIGVDRILYFYSFQKGTYLHTDDNRNYVIEHTLDMLTDLLDPEQFFRINRSHIISYRSIRGMTALSGSKL
ncbi:MAG: LytR/AlgR family response regulator transcription factor, partial [Bacteroidales bacterium]